MLSRVAWVVKTVAHVRVVVATMDAGRDIERFRLHFQRLLVLALMIVDIGDVVVRRRHVRVLRSEHTCSDL